MRSDKRQSGISLIGELPWGSHFCQFYQTTEEQLEILLPFFKAGLENNEFCLWVPSETLGVEDVKKALKTAVPNLETYADKGQMEIIPSSQWHAMEGESGSAVVSMLDRSISGGFDGLRLACNAYLEKEGNKVSIDTGVDAISRNYVIAVFAYPRDKFDALGLMEVVKNHRFALVRNAGRWEVIESSEARILREELKESEVLYRSLFNNILNGFAYCRMLFEENRPADFIYLAVNSAFEKLTGLQDVVGKRVSAVIPGIRESDPGLIDTYGRVARSGIPERFEVYVDALEMWFSISLYSPKMEHFVAVFDVITERKMAEEKNKKLNEELKRNVAELSAANGLLRDSRRASLNMMEDADVARRRAEEVSADLLREAMERKQAEEALRESRERLDLALASSRMATFDWDIVKNKRTWSDGVHSLLGTKPENFKGTAEEFFRIIHPEDRSSVQANLDRAVETIGVYETEYRAVWPDGSIHHISARGKVHSDAAGRAVMLAGVCWDITERKRAEERLWAQSRTLKALNSSSLALLHATDELSLLQAVCRTVVEDCGHAMVWIGFAEEDEEKSVRPVASAGFAEGYLEALRISWADTERGRGPTGTAIRTGKPCGCNDMLSDPAFEPWRNEALKHGYASSLVLPLMGDGKAFGALSIYSAKPNAFSEKEADLLMQLADELAYGIRTVQLRVAHDEAFEELHRAKEAAEAATRAKSQFLANMSHELRTPMGGVLGMLELALGGQLEAQQREYIETAIKSGRSLLRILNDILDLSRVESGKLAIVESPFTLRECVAGTVAMLSYEAQRKGIEITHSTAEDVPHTMIGDQLRLRQVLLNLIGNAVKFTEHGKVKAQVVAGKPMPSGRREITFSITDSGIGIPADKKGVLFHSFSQVDDSHTRSYGGVGLGLAISKEIVELMSGTITFESEEGVGSTFFVTVPLCEAGGGCEISTVYREPLSVASAAPLAEEGERQRLLIAEDDPINRKILNQVFRLKNFEPEFATNGLEAVEKWEKGIYELIVMDVQMPYMDGFEATRIIREKERTGDRHTLIVAMTAHASREDEKRCLDAGMDAFISKPIDLMKSIEVIKDLINKKTPSA